MSRYVMKGDKKLCISIDISFREVVRVNITKM